MNLFVFYSFLLVLGGASDIRVTRVGDAEDTDTEVTTAGSAEVDVGATVVVDVGLRKVSVVLNLRTHKRRAVVGDDHKLGLALAEGLEGLVEAEAVLAALHDEGELGVDTLLGLLLFLDDHFDFEAKVCFILSKRIRFFIIILFIIFCWVC